MENNSDGNSSDKDKKMKESFESSEDSNEKKKTKKSDKKTPSIFKIITGEGDEQKPEKNSKSSDEEFSLINMIMQKNQKETNELDKSENEINENQAVDVSEKNNEESILENNENLTDSEKVDLANEYIDVSLSQVEAEIKNSEPDSKQEAKSNASKQYLESLKDSISISDEVTNELPEEVADRVIEDNSSEHTDIDDEVSIFDEDTESNTFEPEFGNDDSQSNVEAPLSTPNEVENSNYTPDLTNNRLSSREVTQSEDSREQLEINVNRRRAGDFLIGGLIGYVIGKRRGEKLTEKKLNPIKEKLEKQVIEMQNKITEQEMRVRNLASENYDQKVSFASKVKAIESEKQKIKESSNKLDQEINKEASNKTEKIEVAEKQPNPRTVEILSLTVLLEMSESIKIENKSLRFLFESGEINQKQLREIIRKHLNGEKIDDQLPEKYEINKQDNIETLTSTKSNRIKEYTEYQNENNNQSIQNKQEQYPHEFEDGSRNAEKEEKITHEKPLQITHTLLFTVILAIVVAIILIAFFT